MDSSDLPIAPSVTIVRIAPNPVRDQAVVQFQVGAAPLTPNDQPSEARAAESTASEQPGAMVVTVGIYDAAGREIRQIFVGPAGTRMQSIPWDRRDEAGRSVPAGAYYIRLETRGELRSTPVVVLN
jgi:hypothetical protein